MEKQRVLAKNERISLIGTCNERFTSLTAVGSLCRGNIDLEKLKLKKKMIKAEDYYVCSEKIGKFKAGSTVVLITEVGADYEVVGIKTGAVLVSEEVARIVKRRNE